MSLVFTYGTLEIPKVMEVVTGRTYPSVDATAKDFARYLIKDRMYPGMIPSVGETTSGRLYQNLDSKTLRILDEFEDELYTRELIAVQTLGGESVKAFSYILSLERRDILAFIPWCRDYFIAHHLPEYVRSCEAFYRDVARYL